MVKKTKIPHTYVIVFALIVVSAISTYLVPGGEYDKETMEFSYVQSVPQSWQIMTAFYNGFTRQAGIIFFILIIGASFWIVNSCRAIDAGIYSFISFTKGLERNRVLALLGVNNVVIVLIMLMFSVFGAVFGMSEETIAFTIIVIPLAVSMGYDSIVGVFIVYVAAHVGFAGAVLNPFTIGIAQEIAGLPIFSGLEYRIICWIVLNLVTISLVLIYANRVKKTPSLSPLYSEDEYWRKRVAADSSDMIQYNTPRAAWFTYFTVLVILSVFALFYNTTSINVGASSYKIPLLIPVITLLFGWAGYRSLKKSVHFFILYLLFFTIIFLVIGVMGYGWYISEISALFLTMGILSGIAAGLSANEIVHKLTEGARDILNAALVVGLAAGIIVILEDGKVIDTILFNMSQVMQNTGKEASLGIMYMIQALINVVIPSASAKAAITMPIMAPFSDLIGVSRQATVLAFQFGDGFTNMITPTSGILIAVLTIARIPYGKWFKLVFPFILLLLVIGFLLLLPTLWLDISGF